MNTIVKLIYQTFADASGLKKIITGGEDAKKTMNQLSGAARIVGSAFGSLGGIIGGALGAFVQGNIWQVAALGVNFVVEQLGIFKDRSEEAKEKLDELKKATDDYYKAISESYEKAKGKIDKETETRKAQIEITNRMIKAELELAAAKAARNRAFGEYCRARDEIRKRSMEGKPTNG